MSILEAIILGIVQGFTEFLPVSSSGHLVMLQMLFGIEEGALVFDIALHLATLIPVIIIFRKDILAIIRKPFSKMTALLAAALVPTGIIALLFSDFIEETFQSGKFLGIAFVITGLVLWFADKAKNKKKDEKTATFKDAAFIGTAQAIAILPALSRSGLTISAALATGMSRDFALKFSFLLSIPTILGAAAKGGYDMLKTNQPVSLELLPTIIAVIAASVCGYLAIRFMKRILEKGSLRVFSYYVFSLGALILIDQFFFGLVFEKIF
ncbi:MAG: undecaprenyl-diphosphate phosphatase [Eubacteriales bacterium]|nr:undecaprenyl-diphosphate phosphatase [Eubacteriales bacterium]